ncbi:MAG: tRNA (adenosine(37)-N6)-threonylcarbamoyltransferase complex dimerization subunit type 1 TsaB [Kiritimatiellae bacterium]|nr:tRNA (adenosine(37)-N6)-threonylcarbamoyltransferase complex dimerization subunit type 1 TsaB [Kiritimatiellia bacterium]
MEKDLNLLAIDRSTDTQSVALFRDGKMTSRVFAGADSRSGDWPLRVRGFLASCGVPPGGLDLVVVGLGPGSFAGIRAALAFAQGLAIGSRAEVVGMPSTIALTRSGAKVAVVGDARRERYWIALYDGVETVRDFFLVGRDGLGAAVTDGFSVVTPDGPRIDSLLQSLYGQRYAGSLTPLAVHLAEVAIAHPDLLRREPLPIYLQAAVRT